jgi:hypothetical protein
MGGRHSRSDLRPYSRYRVLLADGELTSGALPRSHHPKHRRMLPVLQLDPVFRPTSLIWPGFPPLRHQAFKAHIAGGTKQVGPDFSLFEIAHEDATIRSAGQEAG